jgi:hypothetical protein
VAAARRARAVEVAGRNTAAERIEHAADRPRSRRGEAVRVVTSLWHLCAPYFFAPYPDSGLELGMRRARPLRGWPHLPAEEVGGLAGMARQRRNAMAAVRLPEDQETAAP